jgi:hypothetical protein
MATSIFLIPHSLRKSIFPGINPTYISLYHTLLKMRSQIGESIEELHRKIDVATHSKQSMIKGYLGESCSP